jgi:hypothetical protein
MLRRKKMHIISPPEGNSRFCRRLLSHPGYPRYTVWSIGGYARESGADLANPGQLHQNKKYAYVGKGRNGRSKELSQCAVYWKNMPHFSIKELSYERLFPLWKLRRREQAPFRTPSCLRLSYPVLMRLPCWRTLTGISARAYNEIMHLPLRCIRTSAALPRCHAITKDSKV